MAKSNCEHLQIYKLAESLADEIWDIAGNWEQFAKDTIGKQIVLSVDSIGANIAEGTERHNFADHQRYIRQALSSLNETRYWLRRAYTRHLLTREQIKKLKPIVDELSLKLNTYLKSMGAVPEQHEPS
ncbi:four helix bundle protein [Allocoleopsis franciscana]|uniref:S23 ribosomal protein n=1 Tax=Allocoleopsis franciscana PCC 7113 TaxID=1173027 RepID=K9WE37_9CYAN|nr:four helix bundle protein [Allocoleopsis franciscana]AFZ18645.1 S23 ribosomal protein [Allocoleopsis franciscana PCC 7113]